MGVDFEVRPIGFAAEDRALMREGELPSFFARHVTTFVADGPIDATIGSEAESVHVVPGIGDMSSEAGGYEFLLVRDTVAVGILEAPDVRDGGHVDPAIEIQHAGRDAGDWGVEAFGVDGDLVRDAVVIGVGELVDGLLGDPEVLPVDRAIFVVILEPAARESQFARRQFALEERELFCRCSQGDVIRNPDGVLSDIQVARFATGCRCDVDAARFVHRAGGRVRHAEVARPLERLHLCAECDE